MSRVGLSRSVVLDTAARLADRDGLGALTVSAVARELGVRAPSLYSHVQNAEDLRAGVSAVALTELADRVDRALAGLAGRDALGALADTHRRYAREHPGRYAAAGVLDPASSHDLVQVGRRHAEQLLAVLRGYAVPPEDRVHAVRLVASVVRGFVDLEVGGALAGSEPPAAESWPRVLERLDHALRTWEAHP
ncbi:TetR/AcrR family transcriptional regulator [Nocardioides sp.]|uniref:TetR/AcrR family transcriptional regulator n=1 Tax=Nocardioides sp. TaxID=35761 RepID=UPI0026189FB3|nr:TetR/AcrR family transcriptional regulator [Nocardioides sp.]